MQDRHEKFVNAYIANNRDETKAYVEVYGQKKNHAVVAAASSRLLRNVRVAAEIDRRMKAIARKVDVDVGKWLREQCKIAFADRRKAIDLRVFPCDKCYEGLEDAPSIPRKGCAACKGKGQVEEIIAPTDTYDEATVAIYAGAKRTKEGLQVLLESRQPALEAIARHLGAYEKDNAQQGNAAVQALANMVAGFHAHSQAQLMRHVSADNVIENAPSTPGDKPLPK